MVLKIVKDQFWHNQTIRHYTLFYKKNYNIQYIFYPTLLHIHMHAVSNIYNNKKSEACRVEWTLNSIIKMIYFVSTCISKGWYIITIKDTILILFSLYLKKNSCTITMTIYEMTTQHQLICVYVQWCLHITVNKCCKKRRKVKLLKDIFLCIKINIISFCSSLFLQKCYRTT